MMTMAAAAARLSHRHQFRCRKNNHHHLHHHRECLISVSAHLIHHRRCFETRVFPLVRLQHGQPRQRRLRPLLWPQARSMRREVPSRRQQEDASHLCPRREENDHGHNPPRQGLVVRSCRWSRVVTPRLGLCSALLLPMTCCVAVSRETKAVPRTRRLHHSTTRTKESNQTSSVGIDMIHTLLPPPLPLPPPPLPCMHHLHLVLSPAMVVDRLR